MLKSRRVKRLERLLWQAAEAQRLTAEYAYLPAIDGWCWWDSYRAIAAELGFDTTAVERQQREQRERVEQFGHP